MGMFGFISDAVDSATSYVSETASDVYEGASDSVGAVLETGSDVVSGAGSLASGAMASVASPIADPMLAGLSSGGDMLETLANAVSPYAGDIGKSVLKMPGIGEAVNLGQAAYHTGAGMYDGATGDRDGAIGHAAQAGTSALGILPGVSEVMGAVDMTLGPIGGALKMEGVDAPQSLGDIAANNAVMYTNAIFGKDDSNWIADGDRPTGTRRGEIGAGLGTMLDVGTFGLSGGLRALYPEMNGDMGNFVGDQFGTKMSAPTLGAGKPAGSQKMGLEMHDMWTGLFD